MKIAYLDCFSGISGDMFLGALLDGGLPFDRLKEGLSSLPLHGFRMDARREARHQIFGTRFSVAVEEGRHAHRDLRLIREIIQGGDLSRTVKEKSIAIFESLARVEGAIHNRPAEEVHFHEVGAVDSIIDIVGAVYGLEYLDLEKLFVSPLPLGSGFTRSAHGTIPVPAPATLALLKGVPLLDGGTPHEMVTPTGAALIKGLAGSFGPMPPMTIDSIGYGVGSRDLPDRPNLLRVLMGRDRPGDATETVVVLETNVDDSNPEWLGFLMERLLGAGALDVAFIPVQMKKGRPGVQIQVIGGPDQGDLLMAILMEETTTLGIRFRHSQRRVVPRSFKEVDSPWGKIRVKTIIKREGCPLLAPEYEGCREIALKHHVPLREVYQWIAGLNREASQPA
ncbi:MAG: nickel pincer cofactor biosynthesis protein LarC [Deltaproteobacteria bacterium]|nr:nickel pincer cofactor biosynthesis protein LarC [Deltaproteobacteria bacterium]